MRISIIILAGLLVFASNATAQTGNIDEGRRELMLAESDSLFALSRRLRSADRYEEAKELATRGLNLREEAVGKENAGYAALLDHIADLSYDTGNYKEAIEFAQEASDIFGRVVGKESKNYAGCLQTIANSLGGLGYYEEALSAGREALNTYEKSIGKENISYAHSIGNLAGYYMYLGDFKEAARLGGEAVSIIERVQGKENTEYPWAIQNLAYYKYLLADYEEAIRLGTEALNIRERVLGKENIDYSFSLYNLALCNRELGNYEEAIKFDLEALNIREKLLGKEHADYIFALDLLATCTSFLGDFEGAIRIGTEALKLREKVLGTEHPNYASSLHHLGIYNCNLGNYEEALRFATESLAIREKVQGKESSAYALTLNLVANINLSLGNYEEALRLHTEALEIREKSLGKQHPDYANSLGNLAITNIDLGNYDEALRLGTEALSIYEDVFGKENDDYSWCLELLSNTCFYKKDSVMTGYYASQVSDISTSIIKKHFMELTAQSRQSFWEQYTNWYDRIAHVYAYGLTTDTLIANGYNAVLLSKGLLLNSDIEFSKFIQESGDNEAVKMYQELRELRVQISKLQELPVVERYADVDSLERIAQRKERALMERSKVFGDYTNNLVVTWEQVQAKLSDKDIAVEFVSFPWNDDNTIYVAYVVRKGWDCPRMIPLFVEKQLKKIYPDEYYTTTQVSRLVWEPLEEVLTGVERVYFAPSGELYNIAIESVPSWKDADSCYVGDKRDYYRLSSTRELALLRDQSQWNAAAVYGGLKYGMTAEGLTADSRSFHPEGETAVASTYELYNIADTLVAMRGGALAEQLPATRVEAEAIEKSLEASGVSSTLYTDSIGTEASFKALGGKKTGIIHIGTHGFYFTESEAASLDYSFLLNNESQVAKYSEDKQLTRSGLLFAGANYVLSGSDNELPAGVDDGILTAKELTGIDLRGLDMVVLSACQTGLGEITGDGVFGLQRGFKKAGAQTIVMSLWKVDDEATRLFMTKFFENITLSKDGHPTNKHAAFLAAQQYLRDEYEIEQTKVINNNLTASQRRRLERVGQHIEQQVVTTMVKPYSDPKYWAAFIILDAIN